MIRLPDRRAGPSSGVSRRRRRGSAPAFGSARRARSAGTSVRSARHSSTTASQSPDVASATAGSIRSPAKPAPAPTVRMAAYRCRSADPPLAVISWCCSFPLSRADPRAVPKSPQARTSTRAPPGHRCGSVRSGHAWRRGGRHSCETPRSARRARGDGTTPGSIASEVHRPTVASALPTAASSERGSPR